jgi:hypothetical protein
MVASEAIGRGLAQSEPAARSAAPATNGPASRPRDDMQKCTYVVDFATLSSLAPARTLRNPLIQQDKE